MVAPTAIVTPSASGRRSAIARPPASMTRTVSGSTLRPWRSDTTNSCGLNTRHRARPAAIQTGTRKRLIRTNATVPQAALDSQASRLNENVLLNGSTCTTVGTRKR